MANPEPSPRLAVALDGGTTNTRARLLFGSQVIATAHRAIGVRDAALAGRATRLAEAVREAIREVCQAAGGTRPELIVAAGMLSAEVGLHHVPHVIAPAGLDDLAKAAASHLLADVADSPILFIPGVKTPPAPGEEGWAAADVMRGEECETIGAWLSLPSSLHEPARNGKGAAAALFLWPGSHTKLVAVDGSGRILASHTTLAGELADALARHTLLAASLPEHWPSELDDEALAAGARCAKRESLGRAAFLVRIADLTRALSLEKRAAFWLGAVTADDAAAMARHALLATPAPLYIGGRKSLRGFYERQLRELRPGAPVLALEDAIAEQASALGALAIARRREELAASSERAQKLQGE